MAEFNAERDGLDLRTAIMRREPPSILASVRGDLDTLRDLGHSYPEPEWWMPTMVPPAARRQKQRSARWLAEAVYLYFHSAESSFIHALHDGKLAARGRPGSWLADHAPAPPGAVVRVESWVRGILVLESGELLYDARVERTAEAIEVDPHRTGYPGRPQKGKDLIEDEAHRRADAGEMLPSLKEEVKALRDWFVTRYPSGARPQLGTIENNIRRIHCHAFPRNKMNR